VEAVVASWLPLPYAGNSLNRSMGQPDLYRFVLSSAAIEKLGSVHVHEAITRAAQPIHGNRLAIDARRRGIPECRRSLALP
jgi:hypothetical protein